MVRRAGHALVESVIAGGVAGLVEATRVTVVAGAGSFASWCVLAALAAVGAFAGACVVRGGLALALRANAIASWVADLRAGGDRRAVAAWTGTLVVSAMLVFARLIFSVAEWAHDRFRFIEAGPVALLVAGAVTVLAIAVLVGARVLDRWASPAVARMTWLDGRRAQGALAITALLAVLAPIAIVHRAVPAIGLGGVTVGACLVVAVVAARGCALGRSRIAQLAAAIIALGGLAGIGALGRAEQARGLVVVYGSFGRAVAHAVWWLADRDGDGYAAAWAGGADCDDTDRARAPRAIDHPDDGVDANCTGADARRDSFGVRTSTRPAQPVATKPSFVVITIDALRPDHLGAWGYQRPISPALDAFAAGATRFTWAMTSYPSTRYAIPSLLTGRYASTITREEPPPSIAQLLRDAGWETAAILCCSPLVLPHELRGIQSVDASAELLRRERPGQANADAVAYAAIEWLANARRDRPFWLWLHFYDPHHPYATPPNATSFGDDDRDRYDAEIAFTDQHVASVLAAIDRHGLAASTVVVVTSDHGDEFNEHGLRFHARSLYNQVARIPLLVRVPGARPRVVDTPVSLVDVAPTLLELAGVAGPAGMNGHSLASVVRDAQPAPARPILVELYPDKTIERDAAAAIAGAWKVIWDREANAWSLYSLADPEDSHDRSADQPAPLGEMKRTLLDLLDRELSPTGVRR